MSDPMYLDDVIEETGITERNVKYWSQKYDLPVEKDGRKNVYPPRTMTLLRLIETLSDTELFTHHFIRIQVQRALGKPVDQIDRVADYEQARTRGRQLIESIDSSLGSMLLPDLTSRKSRKSSSRRRRARSGGDLDEGVL